LLDYVAVLSLLCLSIAAALPAAITIMQLPGCRVHNAELVVFSMAAMALCTMWFGLPNSIKILRLWPVIVANIMEQCSLFLPLQRGAGPMALMLWLDWVT
jgi:hypothetical protein